MAAVQGVCLGVVVAGLLPTGAAVLLLVAALALLAESFGRDVLWLVRRHEMTTARRPPLPTAARLVRSTGG